MKNVFLDGENIYLRPFGVEDVSENYLQWINDPDVTRYLDSPFPRTMADLESYVKDVLADPRYVFFAVVEKKTDKHVGNAKIGPINWIHRRANFGRILSSDTRGKGYGAEVTRLMIEYVFEELNLNRIIEHNVLDNKAAVKSNEKAGLDVEGTIQEYVFADGAYRDVVIVGLTRSRYEQKKKDGFFDKNK